MAGKLITLEEAANLLGVTPTELAEMRQRGEAYGIRDGSGWKFRPEDIEKMIADRGNAIGDLPVDLSGSSLDLPDLGPSSSAIDLSDFDIGGGSGPGSSTVIGGKKPAGDEDIEIKFGSGLNLLESAIGIGGPAAPATPVTPTPPAGDSGMNLGSPSGLDLLGSDVKLSTSAVNLDASNVLSGGSSGAGGSDAGKTMLTAELADRPQPSGIKLTLRDSESIFESPDSDLTHNIQGSGINLLDARDSGLALDDLQLAPSASAIGKKKGAGSDLDLKGDDDFLLTPLEEQTDDSTDSGSQVIALDGEFGDDATATLMAGDIPGLGAMLEADGGGMSPLGSSAQAGGMGVPMFAPPPEPSYGIGTVAALGFSSILMTLVGIMMYDIIRNMWSWDTPYSFNSSLMDMILKMIG